jgi:hypothetical protein
MFNILEVSGSIMGQEAGYSVWGMLDNPSKCRNSKLKYIMAPASDIRIHTQLMTILRLKSKLCVVHAAEQPSLNKVRWTLRTMRSMRDGALMFLVSVI